MILEKYQPGMMVDYSWLESLDATPGEVAIDAGYIPASLRKGLGAKTHNRLAPRGSIPIADLEPPKQGEVCRIAWDAAKHVRQMIRENHVNALDQLTKDLYAQIGRDDQLPTYYQQTGSCVGNGGDKAVLYTMAIEVATLKEPESFAQTFMPYSYGRSRSHAGMGNRTGDGSFGSAYGKASAVDGHVLNSHAGLEKPSYRGGLTWGEQVEYKYSAGDRIDRALIQAGKEHCTTIAEVVTDVDRYRDQIRSGRVGAVASNFGGRMRPSVAGSGEWAVLLNDWVTTWMHQMMCSAWMWHPTLGELFYIENSWNETVHGTDPFGGPLGGFWIRKSDMAKIVRQGDSVIFAGLIGWPGQEDGSGKVDFDWLLNLGINLRKRAA